MGVLNIRQGPVPSIDFLAMNSWIRPTSPGSNNSWFAVWAGSEGYGVSGTGTPAILVYIETRTPDGFGFSDKVVGTFRDLNANGPLSLVSGSGNTVELSTSSGQQYSFNLATDQYM